METLTKALQVVSTGLMVPVIVTLLVGLTWATLHMGGLAGEYRDRRRGHRRLRRAMEERKRRQRQPQGQIAHLDLTGLVVRGPVGRFVDVLRRDRQGEVLREELVLGKIVDDLHLEMDGRVGLVAVGTRLGPMLGLMGTLIPMGPALTGLAEGNIAEMSSSLVVAFSTTVLGLLLGGICYVVTVVRTRWYAQDMSDIDFMHDLVLQSRQGGASDGNETR